MVGAIQLVGGKISVNVPLTAVEIGAPNQSASFELHVTRSAVSNYVKDGSDLVIEFDDGRVLRIRGFFNHGDNYNTLVFQAENDAGQEGYWISDFSGAAGQGADGVLDSLVSYTFVSEGSNGVLFGLLGAVALGGVALAGAGGSDDDNGNEQPGDTKAPGTPEIAVSDPDHDGRINASGTAEPGSTLTVTWPDGSTSTTTADGSGNWSVESPTPQGSGTVTATATDPSGNESPPATASADMDAPLAPTLAVNDADRDGRINASGTAEPGSKLTVTWPDGSTSTTTADGSGNWSVESPTPQGSGTVTATATDPSGNESPPATASADMDTPPPTLAVNDADHDGRINASGTAEPGSKLTVTWPDGSTSTTTADGSGNWSVESPTPQGSGTVTATATDPSGNESPPATASADMDTPPPTLAVNDADHDGRINASGTAEPGSTLTVKWPDGTTSTTTADGSGNWSVESPTPQGSGTVTATATDPSGNKSPPATASADMDTPPPTLAVNDADHDGRINASGTAEPGSTLAVKWPNGTTSTTTADSSGNWSVESPTPQGSGTVTATATDPSGNESPPATASADMDTPPPTLTVGPGDANTIDAFGTAEPNATVTITWLDGSTSTVTADGSGNWSATSGGLLTLTGTVTATATDAAGNVSDPTTVLYDEDAPAAPVLATISDDIGALTGPISDGGVTDDTMPTFAGSAEPGATITILDAGTPIGTAIADASGSWSFTPATPLGDGAHSITLTATDSAGNTGAASAPVAFTVDTGLPAAPVLATISDDIGALTGPISDGGVTDDTMPAFAGSAEPGATITILDAGTPIGTAIADASGSWSFTPATPLGDGAHSITLTATDSAGNTGAASAPVAFTVDTGLPAAPVLATISDDIGALTGPISDGGTTDDTMPTFAGSAEPGATITILDAGTPIGTAIADASGSWSFTPATPLGDGAHSITLTATDSAGNTGAASAPVAFTVDTGLPAAPVLATISDDIGALTGPISDGGVTDDTMPTFAGSAEPGATITILDAGTPIGTAIADASGSWSFTPATPLGDGAHSITLTATDSAGNTGAASAPVAFTVDTGLPAAPVLATISDDIGALTGPISDGGVTDDTMPTFAGSAEPGATITILDAGTPIGTAIADASGSWSFTPATPLGDGAHSITLTATDSAGNTGAASAPVAFTVDTTAPVQTVMIDSYTDDAGLAADQGDFGSGTVTNDAAPVLNGTLSAALGVDEVVRIYEGSTLVGTATVSGTGWTFDLPTLADGSTHTYTARVEDAAGNQGTWSADFALSVDTTAPTQTATIDTYTDNVAPNAANYDSGTTTNDTTPRLNGTISAALGGSEVVRIYEGSDLVGTATMDGTTWTYNLSALADGSTHTYTARVEDAAGNHGTWSADFVLSVDTTAPTQTATIDTYLDNVDPNQGNYGTGTTTNDTTPLLNGTLSAPLGAGEVLNVYDGLDLIGTATVTGTSWSIALSGVTENVHNYTAQVADAAGNVGPMSDPLTLTVDITAPTQIATIQSYTDNVDPNQDDYGSGTSTNDPTPVLNGVLDAPLAAGEVVQVYQDGNWIGTANMITATSWTLGLSGLTDNSTYIYTAKVVDAAGNVGPLSGDFTLTADALAPDAPFLLTVTDNHGPVTGLVANGGATDDLRPIFAGSGAEPNAIVTLYDGASVIGTTTADSSGIWSYQPSADLPEGSHSISATVTDAAGNEGPASTSFSIVVDTTAPMQTVTIDTYLDNVDPNQANFGSGTTTNDTTPLLNGTLSAPLGAGEVVRIYEGGSLIGTATVAGTSWTLALPTLADGTTHTYTAFVEDAASNVGAPSNDFSLSVDTSAPTALIDITSIYRDTGTPGDFLTYTYLGLEVRGVKSGTLNAGEVAQLSADGGTTWTNLTFTGNNWTYTDPRLLTSGSYVYDVRIIDQAGNIGGTDSQTVVVDRTIPPEMPTLDGYTDSVGPQTGNFGWLVNTDDTTPVFYGHLDMALLATDVLYLTISNGSGFEQTVQAFVTGTSWTAAVGALAEGQYSIDIWTQYVPTGQEGSGASYSGFTVDLTAPTQQASIDGATDDFLPNTGSLVSGNSTNDASPLLTGEVNVALNPGDVVRIYEGSTQLGTATIINPDGDWQFSLSGLSEGTHTFTARVEDEAGNRGPVSNDFVLTVDTVAPTQTATIIDYTDDVLLNAANYGSGTTTNDTAPQLNGTISAALGSGEVVRVYEGTSLVGTATVTGTSWTLEVSGLANGSTHSYTARVEDAAGHQGAASTPAFTLSVDTTAPTQTVTIDSYADDVGPSMGTAFPSATATDDRTPVLNGTIGAALGSGEVVRVYEGSTLLGTATVTGTSWTLTLSGMYEGTHNLRARVEDAAGNPAPWSPNFPLTVDFAWTVNSQSTIDTTPLVTGNLPFVLGAGEYLTVFINGVTYSSATGAVVIDPDNQTWYVQIPVADTMVGTASGNTYPVLARIYDSSNVLITTDDSNNELIVFSQPATSTVTGETANIAGAGMAVGDLNNDGLFDYFNGNPATTGGADVYMQNGTSLTSIGSFAGTNLYNYGTSDTNGTDVVGRVSGVNFLDVKRDGNLAVMIEDSAIGGEVHYWTNVNGVFTKVDMAFDSGGFTFSNGAQVGIDLDLDGDIDVVHGDKDDAGHFSDSASGYAINNGSGVFTEYDTSTIDGLDQGKWGSFGHTIGAFDLNKDGKVDLIGQFFSEAGWGNSDDLTVLLTTFGGNNGNAFQSTGGNVKVLADVLRYSESGSTTNFQIGTQSMNVADFNGDGNLDLFVGQTFLGGVASRVYVGNGDGSFALASNGVTLSGSTLTGGVSVNTDWNADGKLDVFEFADNGSYSDTLANNTSYEYWQNTTATAGGTTAFTRTLMSAGIVKIIGAVAADFDYDGAQDLIINANGADVFQRNTNAVADGTSLHLKILNPNGYNTYVSQAVNLYNEAGTLVASRVINGQYGYGTNDSRGIVDFYGLSAAETYTVVLVKAAISGLESELASIGGEAIGGVAAGGVNTTWDNLKAGAATSAHVLSAEATAGNNAGTFVGTGYNDTFYASAGNDSYNGSGGSVFVSGARTWSNTGGMDIVDYSSASTAMTVNLSLTTAQNVGGGYGNDTLTNIEGLIGGTAADTFTDSAADNQFEGRGGNDTYNLTNGGHDTLLYTLLTSANATGGNGADTVNGFKIGTWEATANSDRIDLKALLTGYTADANGAAHYINGVATMDAGETIGNYLTVTHSGSNTILSIDRDGAGGTYASTQLLTLNNVTTDLEKLMANHQIVVA